MLPSDASDLTEPRIVIAIDDPELRTRFVASVQRLGYSPDVVVTADYLWSLSASADDELRIILQCSQHPDRIQRLLLHTKWSLRAAVSLVHLIGLPRHPKPGLGIKLGDLRFIYGRQEDTTFHARMVAPNAHFAELIAARRREHGLGPRALPHEVRASEARPGAPLPRGPSLLAHGLTQLEGGYTDVALETLGAALSEAPDNPLAHCILGRALFEWGDLDAALERLLEAIRMEPSLEQAHRLAAGIHFYQEQYSEAVDYSYVSIRHASFWEGPPDIGILALFNTALQRLGRSAEAVPILAELYQRTSDSNVARLLLAALGMPNDPNSGYGG